MDRKKLHPICHGATTLMFILDRVKVRNLPKGIPGLLSVSAHLFSPKLLSRAFPMLCIAIALIALTACAAGADSSARPAIDPSATATAPSDGSSGVTTTPFPSSPSVASSVFFGLTVLNYQNMTPALTFGTTRTWDAWPALDWAEANSAAGTNNFAPLNAFIATAQSRDAQVIYTFGRTPQWASTSPGATGPYGPGQCAAPTLSAWDQYVTSVVTNAAGRIKYWELWNEPDQAASYCGDIPSMVTMAQHAYAIIKKIDPSAVVLSPAASGESGATWLNSFLAAGGLHTFDVVAFHGYGGTQAEQINKIVDDYRQVMSRYNLSALPLWDTEGSWGDDSIGDDAHRAAFLAKYFFLQWSRGVDRVVWYAYDGAPQWGRLIDATGKLLPSGVAYGESYKWIVGATLTQPCSQDQSGTWTCSISRPGGYQAQILWNSTVKSSLNVKAPQQMTDYRDLTGSVHPIVGGTVPVQNLPILLESGPISQ
jgi:polysaccharide biosynthesis protein PslG